MNEISLPILSSTVTKTARRRRTRMTCCRTWIHCRRGLHVSLRTSTVTPEHPWITTRVGIDGYGQIAGWPSGAVGRCASDRTVRQILYLCCPEWHREVRLRKRLLILASASRCILRYSTLRWSKMPTFNRIHFRKDR